MCKLVVNFNFLQTDLKGYPSLSAYSSKRWFFSAFKFEDRKHSSLIRSLISTEAIRNCFDANDQRVNVRILAVNGSPRYRGQYNQNVFLSKNLLSHYRDWYLN